MVTIGSYELEMTGSVKLMKVVNCVNWQWRDSWQQTFCSSLRLHFLDKYKLNNLLTATGVIRQHINELQHCSF